MTAQFSDPGAEAAVAGYLLNRGFTQIPPGAIINPDDFTVQSWQVIYAAGFLLHASGKGVCKSAIRRKIERTPHLDRLMQEQAMREGRPDWRHILDAADESLVFVPTAVADCMHSIADAARLRRQAEIGRRMVAGDINPKEVARLISELNKEPASRLSIRRPSEILSMRFDPADMLLANGYLTKGVPLTLVGMGGLGKSRIVLQLAVSSILGRPFLGWETRASGQKWLILQTENTNRRLQADLSRMLAGCSQEELATLDEHLRLHTIETEDDSFVSLESPDAKAKIVEILREFPASVVVFDVLRDFAIGDLNSDSDMMETLKAVGRVTREGDPKRIPLIVHHALTGKAGASKATGFDRSGMGRNSKVLHGWTRAQINLAPYSPDSNEILVVASGKANDAVEFEPFAVRLDPETMTYQPDGSVDLEEWENSVAGTTTNKPKASVSDVVAVLKPHGNDGVPKAKLVSGVMAETGCSKSLAYRHVQTAEDRGLIKRRRSDGLYVHN